VWICFYRQNHVVTGCCCAEGKTTNASKEIDDFHFI
jgi:hypothetical protein